ncbi:addiction module toxin RelE [Lentibacter algarum]|uniref:addiction module toxin RelE n=1 Tax=Lentibacter algarum TaxID=576131 RepID=UPI00339D9D46
MSIVTVDNGDDDMPIFLITVFAKNEKANLSKAETETVKSYGKLLADSYRSAR